MSLLADTATLKWQNFICPVDQLPLFIKQTPQSSSLVCETGHTYDIAREGYCNLLLVQKKASLEPGDSPEMVVARRNFLEAGFYEPLAMKVLSVIELLAAQRILDAGCGEGYYLRKAHSTKPELNLIGIDISKPAIKAAAKLSPKISYAVASNIRLPIANESVDLILVLFGFPLWEGFAPTQKPGSHVLLVDPAEDHLLELRQIIYPTVTSTAPRPIELSPGYKMVSDEKLNFKIHLTSNSQIQDLLNMTPHSHRINNDGRTRLAALHHLEVTVDLLLRLFVREPS